MQTSSSKISGTAIVLGVETQIGLSIVRELGRAGIKVIALSDDPHALGLSSRYVHHAELVVPRSELLLQKLRDLAQRFGHCSLITVSEANLQWLCREQHHLGEFIHPALPPVTALAAVLDKKQTLVAAQNVGIAIPRTEEPETIKDVERIAESFPFPAVLKWKDAEAIAPVLRQFELPFIKAEYVYNEKEMLAVGHRYGALGCWPLVQQYCQGQGLGQFFFMHNGEVLQRFQHLRIAEWPPEGGFSSVCDAVPLSQYAKLQEQSIQLLREIGWKGVAMVEYRLDLATGNAVLMEINGRFWGSYPLAMQSNAGFALLSHQVACGQSVEVAAPAKDNLRCRMVLTEVKRLVRLLIQPEKILDRHYKVQGMFEIGRFLSDFVRPNVVYFLWSWKDPKPFFRDVLNMLKKLMA